MRCHRVRMSISVWSSMWPMCSDPVTLGGGMTMEKRGPGALRSAWKMPVSTHHRDQCGSNCCGSYAFSNCMGKYYFNREGRMKVLARGPAVRGVNVDVRKSRPTSEVLSVCGALRESATV